MNNITKIFLLVVLISIVHVIIVHFPIFGFFAFWGGIGYVVDQICIKIGQAESTRREKAWGWSGKCPNVYLSAPPLRFLSYLLPPISLLAALSANFEDIRAAFPQIPKFRNPFYYD